MAVHENSAFRLHKFVQCMIPQPDNTQLGQVLLNCFGAGQNASVRLQTTMVARVTILLYAEVDVLVSELRRAELTDESFKLITDAFDRFSSLGMSHQWQHVKPQFMNALPLLRAFAEILPDDGAAISAENLSELDKAIEALRQEVNKCELPEEVKKFVHEQLDFIARAVRDYPIAGAKAFKTAARDAIFHEAEQHEVVATFHDAPQIKKLKAIQEKVVELAKFTVEFSKLLAAADSIYHHAGQPIQYVSGWVQHLLKS